MTDADGVDRNPTEAAREAPIVVSAHTSAPDRTVLTEQGNTDGWIASDLAVEPAR